MADLGSFRSSPFKEDRGRVSPRSRSRSGRSSPKPSSSSSPTEDLTISPRTGLPVREDVVDAQKDIVPEPISERSSNVPVRDFTQRDETRQSVDPVAQKAIEEREAREKERPTAINTPPSVQAATNLDRPSTRLGRVVKDVGRGLTAFSGFRSDPELVGRVQSGASRPAEDVGAFVGTLAFGAGGEVAGAIGSSARAGKAAVAATRLGRLSQSSQVSRFLTSGAEISAKGAAIVEGARQLGQSRSDELGRSVIESEAGREAVRSGREAEQEFVASSNRLRRLGFELVGSALSGRGGREAFREGARESLEGAGLDPASVSAGLSAASREKGFTDVGELGSLLAISAGVERFGRRELSRSLEKPFVSTAKSRLGRGLQGASVTAATIGRAGFIEGFGQELSQQLSRLDPADIGKAATMGGVGTISAATLGGAIAGASVSGSRGLSRSLEAGASVIDVFEKPGDILADVGEGIAERRVREQIGDIPIFTSEPSTSSVRDINPEISSVDTLFNTIPQSPTVSFTPEGFSLGSSVPSVPAPSGATGVGGLTPSSPPVGIPSLFDPISPGGRSTPSPVPTDPFVPVPTDPIIPIPSITETPVPAPVNVATEPVVPVPTNIGVPNIQTSITLPTVFPDMGGFPLFPMGSPGFGGGKARSKKKKKRPTKSVFQGLFNLPDVGFEQVGGQSEVTGLFLRR